MVRNRRSSVNSRNKRNLAAGLDELSLQLGFRCATGFTERTIYREFFPRGLTALDMSKSAVVKRPNRSHAMAQEEVQSLLAALNLSMDEKGLQRVAVRSEWSAGSDTPLEVHDILI